MNNKQRDIRSLTVNIQNVANEMYQQVYFDLTDEELEKFNLDELIEVTQKLNKLSKQLPEFIGLPF